MNAFTAFEQSAVAWACSPAPEAGLFDLCRFRLASPRQRVALGVLRTAYPWPSLQSLQSRGVRLELSAPGSLARIEIASGKLFVERQLAAMILGLAPEPCWALLECIARWAIARIASCRVQAGLNAASWTMAFALRPLLYFYWKNGCLPCDWIEISPDLEQVIRQSCRQENYHQALNYFRDSLWLDKDGARELEQQRFKHQQRQVVSLRHTKDGIVLPLFGSCNTTYISPYNPPRESVRQRQWRLHASNVILPLEDFSLPLSMAELRRPFHVPLQSLSLSSVQRSFAGAPGQSVSDLLAAGTIPVTAGHIEGARWSVLMYGSEIYENGVHAGFTGRTGILFRDAAPVIEELGGIEHLVELKGMGCVTGGIATVMKRSDGTWSPGGGLLQSYAVDEHAALQEHSGTEIGPKPAALLTFSTDEILRRPLVIGAGNPERAFHQWPEDLRSEIHARLKNGLGLVVRLTPSVERLSFFEKTTAGSRQKLGGLSVPQRISVYGAALGRLFRKGRMVAHLSAHLENIVAGEFGFFWQDFADIVPLYVSRAHQTKPAYLSRKKLTMDILNQVFFYVARTAQVFHEYFSVSYAEFSQRFYEAFLHELQNSWELSPSTCAALRAAREPLRIQGEGVTQFLWKAFIASDNFHWCLENYDLPALLFGNRAAPRSKNEIVAADSARTFLESEKEFLQDAFAGLHLLLNQETSASRSLLKASLCAAQRLLERLQTGNALRLADCKLPYLSESEKAFLPRKIESWPK